MAGPNDWFANPGAVAQAFQQSLKQYIDAGVPSPLSAALGVQFEPFSPLLASAQTAPATQAVYGVAVYGLAGAVITGVKFRNAVAAGGTLPTSAFFGAADFTGKMLAVSANVNATTSWATGVNPIPFTATLTLPYSGLYFPCYTVNGTWGTTQPTPITANNTVATGYGADGSNPPPAFVWAAQTSLPAVGSSLTLSTASSRAYYLALY